MCKATMSGNGAPSESVNFNNSQFRYGRERGTLPSALQPIDSDFSRTAISMGFCAALLSLSCGEMEKLLSSLKSFHRTHRCTIRTSEQSALFALLTKGTMQEAISKHQQRAAFCSALGIKAQLDH